MWHLNRLLEDFACASDASAHNFTFQSLVTVDPLMVYGWLQCEYLDLDKWLSTHFRADCALLLVANVEHHWIPALLWVAQGHLQVRTWDTQWANHDPLNALCTAIADHMQMTPNFLRLHRLFCHGHCGAFAVSYLRSVLLGQPLPELADQIEGVHAQLRQRFAQSFVSASEGPKPWLWGTGTIEQAVTSLMPILSQQGVPDDVVDARARAAVRAIGVAQILQATALA